MSPGGAPERMVPPADRGELAAAQRVDFEQPIVTGRAYNVLNRPPEHKSPMTIKSHTHKGPG